jgi:hypothetical protein
MFSATRGGGKAAATSEAIPKVSGVNMDVANDSAAADDEDLSDERLQRMDSEDPSKWSDAHMIIYLDYYVRSLLFLCSVLFSSRSRPAQ